MIEYQLTVSKLAVEDVNEIILWYKEQQAGLEEKFLFDLRKAYSSIIVHPEAFGFYRITPQFRYIKLKRFPYHILYKIDTPLIRVVGIIHTARSPHFVRNRYP